ncbi:MAG: hypothetical protein JXB26_07950 [Candidatus Aminicenantes bacterium]|nr:hypothetical protein [Candidatus Aminicenantes bacterium]
MFNPDIIVSAPGRICLLGEHQDYLGLSIIAAAIDLRIFVCAQCSEEENIWVDLPDISDHEKFPLNQEIPYTKNRDYLKSGLNILHRKGIRFPSGWKCFIHGDIPINSGTASSSALVVAWLKFLLEAAENPIAVNPADLAELGFQAEVAEFHEPGGKMDHYASALGGIITIDFDESVSVRSLSNPLKKFVLADSKERKDTTGTLGQIKSRVHEALAMIQTKIPFFNLRSTRTPDIDAEIAGLPPELGKTLEGTLQTRDLTSEGVRLFDSPEFDHRRFGELLNLQYQVQREKLNVSTPKMDRMIEASLQAGAIGAKINGSGEGGCLFAYTPDRAAEVAEALKYEGADTYILNIGEGVHRENWD